MRRTTIYMIITAVAMQSAFAAAAGVDPGATSVESQPSPSSATTQAQPKKAYVDVFIPSVTELASAAKSSMTARLYEALSGLAPLSENETGEGLDLDAVAALLQKIEGWQDTSIGIAIYTQDREGRPRWSVSFDWPIETLVENLRGILEDPAAKEVLKNVGLKEGEDGAYTLELPEMKLATLRSVGDGSMIASTDEVKTPEEMFGRDAIRKMREKARKEGKEPKKPYLAYCSLNLDSGEEGGRGSSILSNLAGVDAVQYALTINKNGEWREQFGVTWNPVVGAFLKAMFQKVKEPFDCPRNAYVTAVMHLGIGEGMTDQLAGMPIGTIGGRADGELLFAAVPGSGFLPVPDFFYVFRTGSADAITKSIRKFIDADTRRRADDDMKPAWHEETIDGRPVFWHDPAAGGSYGLMPVTFRKVIFFEKHDDEDEKPTLMVIAQTSNWADDAVRQWKDASRETIKLPTSDKIHWQARLNWKSAYQLAQPYLGLLSSFMQGASMPPTAQELSDALADSDVQVKIAVGGVRVRHVGPMPIGAIYVPAVAGAALGTAADPSSEAARERVACRHLRVLYYHSKLFKRDYGRWPATVAELDGYVDFASHWDLLYLRPREKSFIEGFTGALFGGDRGRTKKAQDRADEEASDINDSLYVIDWSKNDADWKLKFRDDEFSNYVTIYIDGLGEIHRVLKPGASTTLPATSQNADVEENSPEKPEPQKPAEEKKDTKKKRKRIVI